MEKEIKKKIKIRYDFITDNPWENEEDIEDSLRLALKLKRPFELSLFSLTFYPETELYEKARQEGIIRDDLNQVYRKSQLAPSRGYLNALFSLLDLGMPKFLVKLLLNKHIPRQYLVGTLYSLIILYKLKRKLKAALKVAIINRLLQGDFQWLWLRSLEIIKETFTPMRHNELPRFTGKPGEI